MLPEKATVIVESVGKAATFYFFPSFPPPPLPLSPGPMLSKMLMIMRVIVLLYPNIE